jgi:hypothetical protein
MQPKNFHIFAPSLVFCAIAGPAHAADIFVSTQATNMQTNPILNLLGGTFALALAAAIPAVSAATVTSSANGNYTATTTWSNSAAPTAGTDCVIQNDVTHSGTASATLAGDKLTINSGFLRWEQTSNAVGTLSVNNLTLNGGSLQFTSSNQFARTQTLGNLLTVSAPSTFQIGRNNQNFTTHSYFAGGIAGTGNLSFVSNVGDSTDDIGILHVTSANAIFSGNWSVNSIDTGYANLSPEAANALGTGSVTLSTRSTLTVAAANAINSTSAVTLTTSTSKLVLTNGWNNPVGHLNVEATSAVDLADSTSVLGAMTTGVSNVPVGTYTAADLTALGFGGTFTGTTGTIQILPLPSPLLVVNPTFTFSNNGNTGSYSIPVSNLAGNGSTALNISGVTPTGAAAGNVTVTTSFVTPLVVAANASGQIAFDFTSTAGSGIYNFNLEIASDDASAASPRVVAVAITVLPSPVLAVASSFSFTNDGTSANYSIPISNNANNGTTPLTITGVNKSGVDANDVSNIVTPTSLAAGASGQITFDFTPSVGAVVYTFNIGISSNDDSAVSPRVIAVTIDVQDPVIAVASNTIDFGSLPSNPGAQTATLTVFNNGGATNLTIDSGTSTITGNTAFSVTSWPTPITPGGSGNIEIIFAPGANQGLFNATLNIVSNDYDGTTPAIALKAFIYPSGNQVAAIDFGTASSPVAANYTRFAVSEGASKTISGVGIKIQSKNADIVASTGATGDNLMTDYAATTFNGGAGNFISVILTGLNTGTLNFISSQNYNNSLGLPLNVLFGEQGGTLTSVVTNLNRPSTVQHSAAVESGKTYELRVLENGNANLAYISGLLMWGDAVPGGTPYSTFVTSAGLDPETTGQPNLDPDHDGVPTGIEWALGGNPNDSANPNTDLLPSSTCDADSLTFIYQLAAQATNDPGTTVFVEYGNDLIGWTKAVNGVGGVTIAEDTVTVPGYTEVTVVLPKTLDEGAGTLFARLHVSL